jgi:hypothetical protein
MHTTYVCRQSTYLLLSVLCLACFKNKISTSNMSKVMKILTSKYYIFVLNKSNLRQHTTKYMVTFFFFWKWISNWRPLHAQIDCTTTDILIALFGNAKTKNKQFSFSAKLTENEKDIVLPLFPRREYSKPFWYVKANIRLQLRRYLPTVKIYFIIYCFGDWLK